MATEGTEGTAADPWPRYKATPEKIRRVVLERDGHRCVKCGRRDSLEINHIRSRQEGGTHDVDNLSTLCHGCHAEWHALESRSAYPYERWLTRPPINVLLYWLDGFDSGNPEWPVILRMLLDEGPDTWATLQSLGDAPGELPI